MLMRFDDISDNTDFDKLQSMIDTVLDIEGSKVLLCLSPFCSSEATDGWVFPRWLMAVSNISEFFKMDRISAKAIDFCKSAMNGTGRISLAGHGVAHVDHRLLCRQAQELSICISSSIVGSLTFVPPFNKWNRDTEEVCCEHGVRLVKFEDGWRHVLYNKLNPTFPHYYIHVCDMSAEEFGRWFKS